MDINKNLKKFLNRPVSELIDVKQPEISEGKKRTSSVILFISYVYK